MSQEYFSDHGGEVDNGGLTTYLDSIDCFVDFSPPGTPAKNGTAERSHRTIEDTARTYHIVLLEASTKFLESCC